ncbi:MAG: uroporphyrinogen decarboxylase family protein [Chloroflexota bacterium]
MVHLTETVLKSKQRLFILPAGYPVGLEMDKAISEFATDTNTQIQVLEEVYKRFGGAFLLPIWDRMIEAEAFGTPLQVEAEMPIGASAAMIGSQRDVEAMIIPRPGHKRTTVTLAIPRLLKERLPDPKPFVLGIMNGPLAVARQMIGEEHWGEILNQKPEILDALLDKIMRFLPDYLHAFYFNDADGVVISEPLEEALTADQRERFSLRHVKRLIGEVQSEQFGIILHNPLADEAQLTQLQTSDAAGYWFGSRVNLESVVKQFAEDTLVIGNLAVEGLITASVEAVFEETQRLMNAMRDVPNYVLAPEDDLPPHTPLANLDALVRAVNQFNASL